MLLSGHISHYPPFHSSLSGQSSGGPKVKRPFYRLKLRCYGLVCPSEQPLATSRTGLHSIGIIWRMCFLGEELCDGELGGMGGVMGIKGGPEGANTPGAHHCSPSMRLSSRPPSFSHQGRRRGGFFFLVAMGAHKTLGGGQGEPHRIVVILPRTTPPPPPPFLCSPFPWFNCLKPLWSPPIVCAHFTGGHPYVNLHTSPFEPSRN